MKTYELLISSCLVHATFSVAQSPKQESENNFLSAFAGGVNALYSNNGTRGSIDLSVQTYHYYMITGKRKQIDSIQNRSDTLSLKDEYRGFEFFLINRAALDFDSVQTVANNYITSLQGSPVTIRFMKEYFLTKNRSITTTSLAPVLSFKITGDIRAVPYGNAAKQVKFGGSSHLFLTLSSQFTRMEFNQTKELIDLGTMYLLPTIGIAIGNPEMMKTIYKEREQKFLISTECRFGFRSQKKAVNDLSFLFRYSLTDIIGPKFRAGVILSAIR